MYKRNKIIEKLGLFTHMKFPRPNYAIIYFENGYIVQSYSTVVCIRLFGKFYFDKTWAISRTTARHVSETIGITATEIRDRIKKKDDNFRKMEEI